jgi:hypothetical protein
LDGLLRSPAERDEPGAKWEYDDPASDLSEILERGEDVDIAPGLECMRREVKVAAAFMSSTSFKSSFALPFFGAFGFFLASFLEEPLA